MATYAQLQAEPWWVNEFTPPYLADLAAGLRAFWNLPPSAVGIKGNNVHLRGYHRSRNWVLNSRYCGSRSYSVSETAGNRSGGNGDWLCALDLTLPTGTLLAACQRLDVAVRAGRLEKIVEWYGNLDGDARVDGYNNIVNTVATSDSSHLWHLHLSFDRGRANDDHGDVFAVLTGGTMFTPKQEADLLHTLLDGGEKQAVHYRLQVLRGKVDEVLAKLDRLSVGEPTEMDLEAVRAIVREEIDKTRLQG